MKITAESKLKIKAEHELNKLLESKDWRGLAELTDPALTPRYKDLIFSITIRKDELELLPDFVKDRFLISYWTEESDDQDEDDRERETQEDRAEQ